MNYLNLGCGYRFHPAWTNIDFALTGDGVMTHNLSKGIPFPDGFFDVVYHSHLLEHFPKAVAKFFMKECYRVLRPQGVLRVAVPDLEKIAQTYIKAVEHANSGSQEWAKNYEWILIEMYDQTVRHQSGGEMATYLFKEHLTNKEFVLERCGIEAKKLISMGCHHRQKQLTSVLEGQSKRLLKQLYRFLRYPNERRELLLKSLLGKEYSALQVGRFRQSGEIHQWMYDRYSLALLLKEFGWENIVQRPAVESYIPEWTSFNLDTEPDGTIYKPDSLFMEAIKPSA